MTNKMFRIWTSFTKHFCYHWVLKTLRDFGHVEADLKTIVFLAQKEVGLFHQPQLVMFVSEDAHYSNMRPGIILGIGLNNVVAVNADKR